MYYVLGIVLRNTYSKSMPHLRFVRVRVVVVGEVVDLVRPLAPVPVVLHQVPQLRVPLLHAAGLEVFPQQPRRPEDARVEPVQLPTGAAGVEPAELSALRSIIVGGVLLNVFKLE